MDLLRKEKFLEVDKFLFIGCRCIFIDCSTVSNQHHLFGQRSSRANSLTDERCMNNLNASLARWVWMNRKIGHWLCWWHRYYLFEFFPNGGPNPLKLGCKRGERKH